jgi:hypothetical protein
VVGPFKDINSRFREMKVDEQNSGDIGGAGALSSLLAVRRVISLRSGDGALRAVGKEGFTKFSCPVAEKSKVDILGLNVLVLLLFPYVFSCLFIASNPSVAESVVCCQTQRKQ